MALPPLVIPDVFTAYPIKLKAGQQTCITIRSTGLIEAVNLDRKGRFWVRLDQQMPVALAPNNFVVYLSRRFTTNKAVRKVWMVAEHDVYVTIEGTSY